MLFWRDSRDLRPQRFPLRFAERTVLVGIQIPDHFLKTAEDGAEAVYHRKLLGDLRLANALIAVAVVAIKKFLEIRQFDGIDGIPCDGDRDGGEKCLPGVRRSRPRPASQITDLPALLPILEVVGGQSLAAVNNELFLLTVFP